MLANMIQKERRMMQGRQKITAGAKSLLGVLLDVAQMEDAVERERKVKEEKRLSTLFSNQSRSVNGYVMLMAFMAISLKRDSQHCCLFSLVTLY